MMRLDDRIKKQKINLVWEIGRTLGAILNTRITRIENVYVKIYINIIINYNTGPHLKFVLKGDSMVHTLSGVTSPCAAPCLCAALSPYNRKTSQKFMKMGKNSIIGQNF